MSEIICEIQYNTVALKILKYVIRMENEHSSPRSKAWAMARCAELQPGERVLDPMCGKVRRSCWTEQQKTNIRTQKT